MPPGNAPSDRGLFQLIEKQLRNWEIAKTQSGDASGHDEKRVFDCLSISRSVGVGAHEIGKMLAGKLEWPLFHKDILQAMAEDNDFRQRMYATMDTRVLGWIEGFIRGMFFGRFGNEEYFHRLTEAVLSIASKGRAIFVGRATHLILPQNVGFRVRLVASDEFCVNGYATQKGIPIEEAARAVESINQESEKFVRSHFAKDIGEATHQDLILDVERYSSEQVVELILSAMRIRGILN